MRLVALIAMVMVAACSGPVATSPSPSHSAPASPRPAALATGGILEYPVPVPAKVPADCGTPCPPALESMALGSDGNVWFVDVGRQQVGRITPSGQVAQFTMPVALAGGAQTIAAGPDHNVWVLGRGAGGNQPDWILRVTPTGDVTKFATLSANAGTESIALGPDGNLWFTEFWASRIGRVTPSGAVTESATIAPDASPRGITVGADGNLWFAETNRARIAIGRISPQGQQSDFPLAAGPSDASPNDVALGPDGNVWFSRWTPGGLGHISPAGEIVPVALPQGVMPTSLVRGPDGNMWFSDQSKDAIARVTVAGAVHEFPLPRRGVNPTGIAVGADGRVWFSEGNAIGSIGVKVPELLLSQPDNIFGQRVMIYPDASARTLKVTNTGNGTLVFGSVNVSGVDHALFVKQVDTCSGKSVGPGSSCSVTVGHTAAGPSGVHAARLELSDNATGSPQKISLVAQLPNCKLPESIGVPNQPQQGSLLDLSTGHGLYDPTALFEANTNSPGVRTTALPVLMGATSAYFDRAQSRWLPVSDRAAVSPDGSRYAYTTSDPNNPGSPTVQLHVVDVAAAKDHVLSLPQGFWGIVAFGSQGVYLNQRFEGIGPGLTLVDPDTGSLTRVLTDGAVGRVDGTTAWVGVFNTADKLPQPPGIGGGSNEIDKRDIATRSAVVWFYAPGTNLYVSGLVDGSPLISVWDGTSVKLVLVTEPNRPQPIDFPFTNDSSPSYTGFVKDAVGTWIGSPDGVYLWTARTGAVLVSDEVSTPAGACA